MELNQSGHGWIKRWRSNAACLAQELPEKLTQKLEEAAHGRGLQQNPQAWTGGLLVGSRRELKTNSSWRW